MKKASLILALLVAAAPLASIAQSQNEFPTNLPGITTTAAPPAGFDPLRASDADLAYYGFPPRPNDYTGDYKSWAEAMAASQERIVPVLEQTNIYHGPATKGPSPAANEAASYNWSGAVHTNSAKSYGKSSYYYAYSDITVPTAKQASGACTGGWDYGSGWVGIDGWSSKDVLQDGIEFDAYCKGKTKATFYSAWFEWYPFSEVRIGDFHRARPEVLHRDLEHFLYQGTRVPRESKQEEGCDDKLLGSQGNQVDWKLRRMDY